MGVPNTCEKNNNSISLHSSSKNIPKTFKCCAQVLCICSSSSLATTINNRHYQLEEEDRLNNNNDEQQHLFINPQDVLFSNGFFKKKDIDEKLATFLATSSNRDTVNNNRIAPEGKQIVGATSKQSTKTPTSTTQKTPRKRGAGPGGSRRDLDDPLMRRPRHVLKSETDGGKKKRKK